ncbi:MAG: phosphoribosylamine--glycine ligase [Bacteroidales bacterium]|nr:phosphoribosylamine--glycine ligase [Bacteroidales bacterium]MDD4575331.1 phosphoribosylamine--glycine ligase [Bacteroidales bacterium]
MNILILGSGGRECTLAWKISKSKMLSQLFIAPGNAGTSEYGINITIKETDFQAIAKLCKDNKIEMIVVGPEQALADGIQDYFAHDTSLAHIAIIGPSQHGAKLESSKEFAKKFMKKYDIPTAAYQSFDKTTYKEALEFLKTMPAPYVIKADGLAAGKGVVIPDTYEGAEKALKEMLLDDTFGKAGNRVVIEEFLDGIELSVFILTDGKDYVLLPEAKDYKRIGEGNTGLNTGGMGSISPVPFANKEFMNKVIQHIIEPTLVGLQKEKIDYCGFLFLGLIKVNNNPYVIEYNVRLGDPETESVIPRVENDLLELFIAAKNKKLHQHQIRISNKAASTIVMVSGGYPESFQKGFVIHGITQETDNMVFHAGTSRNENNEIISAGGRVLAITSLANSPQEALKKCYAKAEKISFNNFHYRKDIGFDIL